MEWIWGPSGRQEARMLARATPGLHLILLKKKVESRSWAESEVVGSGPDKQEIPSDLKAK